ncbi:AlpA family transcriptional regulator [Croceicoccus naphthovorans]|uniref:Uncharacterized protein n=1 Tax=Croceicoccus naphthovorans TaxID=1348774 RepID=A0A0G3XLZ1_9SPHN|nr:AlpA family transcriptional regulator [Croceicoccus naphthovorans]AKM11473.1 hypothetical protein AB433_02275 [Croceicoccus naphthovorans]MBB3991436.1 prophage regulatory protein [Croceicoccus naphthovorans]
MPFLDKGDDDLTSGQKVGRVIRLKEVIHRTGLGRSTIYRWMREGKFPKAIKLGGHSVAWVEQEIDRWLTERCR